MTIKFKSAAMIAGIALIAAGEPVHADVTVTTRAVINSPMLDKAREHMTAEQISAMDAMMQSKTYMSGKRYRVESSIMTMIVDAGTKQMTMLNDKQRTYVVMPIGPNMMKGMLGGAGAAMAGAGKPTYKVTDSGKTTKYLGHTCRHYVIDMKMTAPNMGTMIMHSDVLAAQDLPGLDPEVYSALGAQMGIAGNQMKGVPLVTNTKMSSALTGAMTVSQTATDISTDPIPASEFETPEGYIETTAANLFSAPGAMPVTTK